VCYMVYIIIIAAIPPKDTPFYLEHANITCKDMQATCKFFNQFFSLYILCCVCVAHVHCFIYLFS